MFVTTASALHDVSESMIRQLAEYLATCTHER